MGLIKAGLGALGGTLADQWKEFFYCEAIDKDILVTKGVKQTSKRSSNTKGNDNIISHGSGIAVADGQCMIIVEQGKIIEVCDQPGEYTYDSQSEPSVFAGDGIRKSFSTVGRRFGFGGDTGRDQRIYYFNTKEILDNKFGTPSPVMFRVVDRSIGFDMDVSLRCSGVFSYKIIDPVLFYTNVCGNVTDEYTRDEIDGQLKTELVSALQPALANLSAMELRPSQIIAHNTDIENGLNEQLSSEWGDIRGLKIVKVAMGSVTLTDEDAAKLREAQEAKVYSNPGVAAGAMAKAQSEAMKTAAGNSAGAMTGFMGMGFASNAGGLNAGALFEQAAKQQQAQAAQATAPAGTWVCTCGQQNTGKFCQNCGAKGPEAAKWVCSCGTENTGKFCSECGARRPE